MNPENSRGLALIPASLLQRGLNKFLLEHLDGFVQENSFLNHLRNQRFQFLSH